MAENLVNLRKASPLSAPPPGRPGLPHVSCTASTMGMLAIILGSLAALSPPCRATDVRVVAVTPGASADLVIEDGAPVTIQVGQTIEGVKLLRANMDGAVVSAEGTTEALPLGKLCTGRRAEADGWLSHEEESGEPGVGLPIAACAVRGTRPMVLSALTGRASPAAAAAQGGNSRPDQLRAPVERARGAEEAVGTPAGVHRGR